MTRTDHGLIGGVRAYQEGRKKPELVYAFEGHPPVSGVRSACFLGKELEIRVWLDLERACVYDTE